MVLLDDCRTRLRGALDLLQRIGVARDPQVREGFQFIKGELTRLDSVIQRTHGRSNVAEYSLVQSVQIRIYQISRSAGRLLRASNARNAFEWFAPFAALFRKVVNGSKHANDVVVFSSEWHSNLELERLPLELDSRQRFAWFIGYPAFESENPHVLPVVGHEIGHALWYRKDCECLFKVLVEKGIRNHFGNQRANSVEARNTKKSVYRQLEELFCDTVGALLFGPSFLHAFRYLLAPAGLSHGVRKTASYPDISRRAQYLIELSSQLNWPLPREFSKVFLPGTAPPEFQVVDDLVQPLQQWVTKAAINLMQNVARTELYCHEETQTVLKDFSRGRPCTTSVRVSSIINASYLLRDGHGQWLPELTVPQEERDWLLSDLVFKSLELMQFSAQAETATAQ